MFIKCKNKPQKVTLASILKGECFIDDDGDLMMKIETINGYNCVDVSTGFVYDYDEDVEVTPVKSSVDYSF